MKPSHLFKFSPVSLFTYESIILGQSWYSSPSKLNDPYDGQLPVSTKVSDPYEATQLIVELTNAASGWTFGTLKKKPTARDFQKVFDEFAREFLGLLASPGILSLTANPGHLLMWSHYANSHQGIALRFQITEDMEIPIAPIQYTDSIPKIHIRDFLTMDSEHFYDRFLIKGSSWSYEEEWRALSLNEDTYYPQPGILDGIVFGHRTPASTVKAIMKVAGTDVEYLEATPSDSSFEVAITPKRG